MTITTIKRITPDIEASVINQFKAWAQTKSGQDILMEFDTWHAFEVEGGAFVDVNFYVDETLNLDLYPCNTTNFREDGNTTTIYLSSDHTNQISLTSDEIEKLLPKWLIEYYKTEHDWLRDDAPVLENSITDET